MKNLISILAVMLMIVACGQNQPIQYTQREAPNGAYVCDIPSSVPSYNSAGDMMVFMSKDSHTTIMVKEMRGSRSLDSYIEEMNYSSRGFNVNVYRRSDNSLYAQITRGSGMWSAYDLFKSKSLDGKNYIIQVSSDTMSKASLEEIINHIHESLKSNNADAEEEDSNEIAFQTFSNQSFSLSYPSGWRVIENPDGMSDVYIGAENGRFGFTVLHFPCEYSLQEVIDEAYSNSRAAGIKIVENKKTKVCGADAYRSVYSYSVSGLSVKEIGYTFVAKGEAYNVKFGTDPNLIDENVDVINEIIKSFKVK